LKFTVDAVQLKTKPNHTPSLPALHFCI